MISVITAILIILISLVVFGIVVWNPDNPPVQKIGITKVPVLFSHKNTLTDNKPGKPGMEILVTSTEYSNSIGRRINFLKQKLGADQVWVTADYFFSPYWKDVEGLNGKFVFGKKIERKQNLEELIGKVGLFITTDGVNNFWLGEEILEIVSTSIDFDVLTLLVSQYLSEDSNYENAMRIIRRMWVLVTEYKRNPEIKELIITKFPSQRFPIWIHSPEKLKYTIIPLSH